MERDVKHVHNASASNRLWAGSKHLIVLCLSYIHTYIHMCICISLHVYVYSYIYVSNMQMLILLVCVTILQKGVTVVSPGFREKALLRLEPDGFRV